MASGNKIITLILILLCLTSLNLYSQSSVDSRNQRAYSTIILFRTFDIFSWDRGYKLYANDSLLGRFHTHDVIVIETYATGIAFRATTKAPSLNATKRTNYLKKKHITYSITLKPGEVYFVKCGYLAQNLFDLPRQPTIKLLKPDEMKKYLKKRFLRRKLKRYSYKEWLDESGVQVE